MGIATAFQDAGIAGFQTQSKNVECYIWALCKNDIDDAHRDTDHAEFQAVIQSFLF